MPIPWLSIIMFIISFLTTKSAGGSTGRALLMGTLAGGATYAVTHSNWAKDTFLADWDNADAVDVDGKLVNKVLGPDGNLVNKSADVLKSWGAAGTAGVIATTAAATSIDWAKLAPWGLGVLGLLVLTR